jgi:DNA-binding SARP family transcriptional activator/tetratricopeptide (TPR) repeat protein
VKYGVLGPLLVTDGSGQWVRLRGHRQRSLLALLLFHANTRVPAERLVNALWPDLPPKSYASNLHTYLSRLRERFGPIEHVGDGYRFAVDTADLDLLVFRAEADRGRRARQAGDPATAAVHLRTALAQWRGRPLDDVHLPVLDAEVARLEDERLSALEDCLDAELAAGRDAELIGELRVAVAEHPLRERLTGLLMIAMQRSGRQADALEVYRRTRATLVEETGLDPGAGLRAVHAAVLRGDDTTPWPVRQLPAESDVFTGREESVAELTSLLAERRAPVVLLTGEPGAGKSTLALRVAHRVLAAFPDGQLYANLAGATEPRPVDDVLADLLRGLGVVGQGIPEDTDAKAAVLRSRLADRQVLLVLDDAADPGQVRPLIPGTPTSAVLVTSRRRLTGLGTAHRVTVGSLRDGEARELLVRLAGDRVAAEPAGAARIAAACGNLPLALRIAGTRLALRPGLSPAALADRLEDERRRLDELAVSDLQVRSSLALSYRALSAPAAALFRKLGMVGVGSLPAWALGVLADDPAGERAVDELIESSLLQPVGADRYELHDLVHAYARELSRADDPELSAAGARLLDTVLGLADRFARLLPRAVPMPDLAERLPDVLDEFEADAESWFAAERLGLVAAVVRMCAAERHTEAALLFERLARYLWQHGFHDDLRTCATALAGAPDERIRVRASVVLALVLHVRGEYRRAEEQYRWCAAHLVDGWVLVNLADCLTGLGEPDEALALAAEAEELLGMDEFGTLAVARVRSAALNRLGRPDEAVRIDTEALAVARRAAEPRQVAQALQSLSWSLTLTGRLDGAAAAATEAVALLRGLSARSSLARSLRTLGAIHAGRGERTLALQAFAEGRELAEELNERPRVLACTRALAAGLVGAGRADDAVAELRTCLSAYREMGSVSSATVTLRLLASAYTATGDTQAAAAAMAEADRLADPRDANADTLVRLLLNLTRVPDGPLNRPVRIG